MYAFSFALQPSRSIWISTALFFFLLVVAVPLVIILFRCHDLNLSALMLILLFVPGFNVLFALALFLVKGTQGPNKFGPQPPSRITLWTLPMG